MTQPLLLSPVTVRGVALRNRVVISPLCQYSARDGMANDWRFAHLARFALGGVGAVFVEATGVHRDGASESQSRLPLRPCFELLDELGYDGWVGCEYRPARSTGEGLGWARRWGVRPA